jgi:hypothetical protein
MDRKYPILSKIQRCHRLSGFCIFSFMTNLGIVSTFSGSVANVRSRAMLEYDLPLSLSVRREGEIMVSFKRAHFPKDMSLVCVRWYVAYSLSYRQDESWYTVCSKLGKSVA